MDQLDRLQTEAVWIAAEHPNSIAAFDSYERVTGGAIFSPELRASVSGNQLRSVKKALNRPNPRLRRSSFDIFKHIKLKPGYPDLNTSAAMAKHRSKYASIMKTKKHKKVQINTDAQSMHSSSSESNGMTHVASAIAAFAMAAITYFPAGKRILGVICQAYVKLVMDRHGSGSTGPPNYISIQHLPQAMLLEDGKHTTDIAVLTIPCLPTAQDHVLTKLPTISPCGKVVFVTIRYNEKSNVALLQATKEKLLDLGCSSIVETFYNNHITKARKHGVFEMTYGIELPDGLKCNANLDCNKPLHKKTPNSMTPFPVQGDSVENTKSKKLSPVQEESTAIVLNLAVEDAEADIDANYSSDDASAENDQFISSIANGYQKGKAKANGTKSDKDRSAAARRRPDLNIKTGAEMDDLAERVETLAITNGKSALMLLRRNPQLYPNLWYLLLSFVNQQMPRRRRA